jgi:hypothetical protein
MKRSVRLSVLVAILTTAWGQGTQAAKTDDEIKQAIINESIA